MDTVGDAYVVIAVCDDEASLSALCADMITLAKDMIIILDEISQSTGEKVCVSVCACLCEMTQKWNSVHKAKIRVPVLSCD